MRADPSPWSSGFSVQSHFLVVILSYRSESPSGCVRRASGHATKVESPGRDLCKSCSKRSRPSDMRRPRHSWRGYASHIALTLTHIQLWFRRIDHDCSPGQALWSPRPTTGVPEDQTRLGLMCWCNPHVSQCHERQEGWSGPPRRPFCHHRQKWMGVSGGAINPGSLHYIRL